jgi:hypothetical protein
MVIYRLNALAVINIDLRGQLCRKGVQPPFDDVRATGFPTGGLPKSFFRPGLGKPRANSDLNEKRTILANGEIKVGGPPLISFEARIFFSPEANYCRMLFIGFLKGHHS